MQLQLAPVGVGELAERVLVARARPRASVGLRIASRRSSQVMTPARPGMDRPFRSRRRGVSTDMQPKTPWDWTTDPRRSRSRSRRWWALALLCGAFFMVILDATIVLVALPSIGADLGFSEQGLQWVLSAYALTFGGLLLLGGRAADLLGRRRVFMAGVLLFTAASLLCGLAWSPAALLAARVVPGRRRRDHDPDRPLDHLHDLPRGLRAQQGARDLGRARRHRRHRGVADRRPARRRPRLGVDLLHQHPGRPGRARAVARAPAREPGRADAAKLRPRRGARPSPARSSCSSTRSSRRRTSAGATPRRSSSLAGSAVLLAAFALIESRHRAPLVPLRILRSRTLVGANLVMLLVGTVAVGMPFVLTLYAQQVLGYSALEFGVGSVVLAVGGHGRRDRRSGARSSRSASGRSPRRAWRSWAPGRSCSRRSPSAAATSATSSSGCSSVGPGIGLAFVTATVAALAGVAEHESGLASGLSNTALQIGARARRRHRHDGCRLPLRGLPGGERRREPARRAERGLPVRLPRLRRAGRDRHGAGAPAPRPAARRHRRQHLGRRLGLSLHTTPPRAAA